MNSELLVKYAEWVENTTPDNISLIGLLQNLGFMKIIWMVLSRKEIHVIEHSEDVDNQFLRSMMEDNDVNKIKEWVKDSLNSQLSTARSDNQRIVLYVKADNFNNLTVVVSEEQNSSHKIKSVRLITKTCLNHISYLEKVNTLENALRLGMGEEYDYRDLNLVSDITVSKLKPSFVNEVTPHVFYSFVHEAYGPFIFESVPTEMRDNPDHIITAVKLFSSLDAEMVAEMGHIFTINPIKSPVMGEVFSLIFTLPSVGARGKFEVHCISSVIPKEFFNFTKAVMGEMKTRFFMAIEKIRLLHEEKGWSMAVRPLDDIIIPIEITQILEELRKNLALTFALKMAPSDVLQW